MSLKVSKKVKLDTFSQLQLASTFFFRYTEKVGEFFPRSSLLFQKLLTIPDLWIRASGRMMTGCDIRWRSSVSGTRT